MSNIQSQQNCFAVQAIVQRVKFEYHAPDVANRGLGQLAEAIRRDNPKNPSSGDLSPTVSAFLVKIPYSGTSYAESDLIKVNQDVRRLVDQSQALDGTTMQVSQWYEALKALQRAALNGRRQARIEPDTLREIEEQMKPYNIGWTWRVRFQARWWYPEMGPGMHPCKSGGYSQTKVLRTLYFAETSFKSAEEVLQFLESAWGKDLNGATSKAAQSTVIFDDRGTYVRTIVKSGGTIVTKTGKDGSKQNVVISRDVQRQTIAQRTAGIRKFDLKALAEQRKQKPNNQPPTGKPT